MTTGKRLLSAAWMLLVLAGCGGGGGTAPGNGTGSGSGGSTPPPAGSTPLSISTASSHVAVNSTVAIIVQGGMPPYTLALASGAGTIDASASTYTAPSATGTAVLTVRDAGSATSQTAVSINPALGVASPTLTMTASSGQTWQIPASGGTGTLNYSLVSGTGSIDANGLYTAGSATGTDVVQVADANGVTATVQVRLLRMLTNGSIQSLVQDSSATYVAGNFSRVHPSVTAHLAALDLTTSALNLNCDVNTGLDDTAAVLLQVGNAVYVGGTFRHYQGLAAPGLLKIDATTCAMDTAFTQAAGFSTSAGSEVTVTSLATDGVALYVGGLFNGYRGTAVTNLAKLALGDGSLDPAFTPGIPATSPVVALAASTDGLFVAARYDSAPRKLDLKTGAGIPAFHPTAQPSGTIATLQLGNGSLYMTGNFPDGVARLDEDSGAADAAFAHNHGAINSPSSLALAGNWLYLSGDWTSLGGNPAVHFGRIDALTGAPDTAFNASSGTDTAVVTMTVAGDDLYISGANSYAGQGIPGVGRLHAATGALDSSFKPAAAFDAAPQAMLVSGNTLMVAGYMLSFGGAPAQNIAKFDRSSGLADGTFLTAGGPGPGTVTLRLLVSGSSLFVAGNFSTYSSITAHGIARIDTATGQPDSQFSQGSGFDVDGNQSAGAVYSLGASGNALFVGGKFVSYRGVPVAALAKLDMTTGDLDTTFNQSAGFSASPGLGSSPPVTISAVTASDTAVYVSGNFTSYRGTSRYLLAKLDPVTGTLDQAFAGFPSGQTVIPGGQLVFNVLRVAGSRLYAAASTLGTLPNSQTNISGLARFDALTGAGDETFTGNVHLLTNEFAGGPLILDLLITDTGVYAAGDFLVPLPGGSGPGRNLVKLDVGTGATDTTFTQSAGPALRGNALSMDGGSLIVGGDFTTYRDNFAGFCMKVDATTGALQ